MKNHRNYTQKHVNLLRIGLCFAIVAGIARMVAGAPEVFESHLRQGHEALAQGRFEQAIEAYQAALTVDDISPGTKWVGVRELARRLIEQERPDDAVPLLVRYWRNETTAYAGDALRMAGEIRRQQGRYANALEIFNLVDEGAYPGWKTQTDLLGRADEMRARLEAPPGFWIAPYVPYATPSGAEMVWVSRRSAPAGTVRVSREETPVAIVEAIRHDVADEPDFVYQRASITGLETGQNYFYQVSVGDETRRGSFRTPPAPGHLGQVRFAVYGDSQDRPNFHVQTSAALAREAPDFVLHLGDMVGRGSYWGHWKTQFFDPAAVYLSDTVILPTVGNHDGFRYYDPLFVQDRGINHSFRSGNVEVFIVASYRGGGRGSGARREQLDWVANALQASDAEWKFVTTHYPMIWSDGAGWSNWGQEDFLPIFEEYGVDIVFAGHHHHYRRSLPIAGEGRSPVLHIVSGGAASVGGDYGHAGVAPPLDPNPMIVYGDKSLHYLIVTVEGRRLQLEAKHRDGTVFDRLVLEKNSPDYEKMHVNRTVPFDIALEAIRYFADRTDDAGRLEAHFKQVPEKHQPMEFVMEHPETVRDVSLRVSALDDSSWQVSRDIVPLVDGKLVFEVVPATDVRLLPGRIEPPLKLTIKHVVDGTPLAPQTVDFRVSEASYMDLSAQLDNGMALPLMWNFRFDPDLDGLEEQWYAGDHTDDWPQAPITQPWNEVFDVEYNGNAWYQTVFEAPPVPEGQRLYLQLGSADESCWVYLNGELLGGQIYDSQIDDDAWRKPRRFPLATALKPGVNILAVRVRANVGQGGLYRGARLVLHPRNRVPDGAFAAGMEHYAVEPADALRIGVQPGYFVDEQALRMEAGATVDGALRSETFPLRGGTGYRLDLRYGQDIPSDAAAGLRFELRDARDDTLLWSASMPSRVIPPWEELEFEVIMPDADRDIEGRFRVVVPAGGTGFLDEIRVYPIVDEKGK